MLALWVAILRLIVSVVAILILIPTVRAIIKSWIAVSSLVRIKATVCLLFDCGIDSDSRVCGFLILLKHIFVIYKLLIQLVKTKWCLTDLNTSNDFFEIFSYAINNLHYEIVICNRNIN